MRHKFVGILNAKRERERERARANAKKKKRGRKRNDLFEKKSTKRDLATFAKPRLLLVFARSPNALRHQKKNADDDDDDDDANALFLLHLLVLF